MNTLNNLKAKAKDLLKLGTCITKTEQRPYPTEALQKSLPKCYVIEELRETIENRKMGIGFDDLADVNYSGCESGPSRLGFVLRAFRI
jgi:hypothetical protein